MSYSHSLTTHMRYRKIYLPQNNKKNVLEKPVVFGMADDIYEKHKSPFHFKFIISPENPDVDLNTLASCFISRLEYLTGHKMYWQAAIHTDTGHPHLHICLNGRDGEGKKIFFNRELVKNTMREINRDIATKMVGPRTEEEIMVAKKKELTAFRWTTYDRLLKQKGENIYYHTLSSSLQKRMDFLLKNNFATMKNGICTLNEDSQEVLSAAANYNTFLDAYNTSTLPVRLYDGTPVKGRVIKIYDADEYESFSDAVLIQTGREIIFVPGRNISELNIKGKTVSVHQSSNKHMKRITRKDIHIIPHNEIEY